MPLGDLSFLSFFISFFLHFFLFSNVCGVLFTVLLLLFHLFPFHPASPFQPYELISSVVNPKQWLILVIEPLVRNFWCAGITVTEWPFLLFWQALWATPQPLYDWFRLLSLFKGPFNPELDYISHSGWNSKRFCSVMLGWPTDHFGPFWSVLVHLMGDPMTPPWLFLTPVPFIVSN